MRVFVNIVIVVDEAAVKSLAEGNPNQETESGANADGCPNFTLMDPFVFRFLIHLLTRYAKPRKPSATIHEWLRAPKNKISVDGEL